MSLLADNPQMAGLLRGVAALQPPPLDPPWMTDPTPGGWTRLSAQHDSGILWTGRVARIAGCADYRLRLSTGHWVTHRDALLNAGAAWRLTPGRGWDPLAPLLGLAAGRPAVLRLRVPIADGCSAFRWAAWDGCELLVTGPELASPAPSRDWHGMYAVAVDPLPARRYLAEVGEMGEMAAVTPPGDNGDTPPHKRKGP